MNALDLLKAGLTVLLFSIAVTVAILLIVPWISLVLSDITTTYGEYVKWVARFG